MYKYRFKFWYFILAQELALSVENIEEKRKVIQ